MPSLERIDVQLAGIGDTIANKRMHVPPYQRLYAWTDDQISDLFRDIADAIRKKESEYFLGTVVLTRSESGPQMIIDGQQRLTTISIFIAAVRDYLYKNGDIERADSLQSDFLSKKDFATLENTPHVRLSDQDHEFFNTRILTYPPDQKPFPKPSTTSQTLIERAATQTQKFVESLVATTQDPKDLLVGWILYIRQKAKIIVVDVASEANAFTIFEVLNDRGLDLSIADLLKNYLFKTTADRVSEAQTSWVKMTSTLDALGEKDAVKTFIRHVWASQHGLTREKDLYDAIRRHVNNKQAGISFIKDLESKAIVYAALQNQGHEFWKSFGPSASQAVEALGTLRATQIRPLLIAVLTHFSEAEVRKALPMFVAWTVRFMVVGTSGSGPLETNYSDRARDISEKKIQTASQLWKEMQRLIPSDEEFKQSFAIATVSLQYLARYYLGVLDASRRAQPGELIVNPNEDKVNLEHIMPQSRSSGWEHISQDDFDSYKRRIGNLTLLDKKLNEKAGNVAFSKKVEVFKQSEIPITKELASLPDWTPARIEERQRQFAEIAVKAWPSKPAS